MRRPLALAAAGFVLTAGLAMTHGVRAQEGEQPAPAETLRAVSDFESISDPRARSVALFEEAGKVILHPRCVNCHPATDRPLQGMAMVPHQPPVTRGEANFGMPGMTCNTCHGPENIELIAQADGLESIPGHPEWHLAPIEMAWENRSLGEICLQIKDVERNGGKDMAELVAHMAEDSLVGWGWNPGKGRQPAPGTQQQFGEIFEAWADSGAECPPA